jgi:hypothetical protein
MDITQIFENIKSDLLTEEVKTKITTLFEAAVNEKVNAKIEELNASAEEFKVQEATKLEEKAVEFVDKHLLDKIDEYLDYVSQEYVTENKLAITDGLKASMFDKLVGDVKKVLSENQIKEDKVEEAQSLFDEVKGLKEQLNESIKVNMDYKKKIKGIEAVNVFEDITRDCSVAQKEKMVKICEDFDIDNIEEFKTKVQTIKESITAEKKEPVTETVVTTTEEKKEDEVQNLDEDVKIKLEDSIANNNVILDGMMKYI